MRPHHTPQLSRRLLAAAWPAFALLVLLMMSCAASEQCLLRSTQHAPPCCERAAAIQAVNAPLHIATKQAHRQRGDVLAMPAFGAPHLQIATLVLAPKTSPPV